MKLKDIQIKNAKTKDKQYKLFDGEGLYLLFQVLGIMPPNLFGRVGL